MNDIVDMRGRPITVREQLTGATPVRNVTTGQGILDRDPSLDSRITRNLNLDRKSQQAAFAECDLVEKACTIIPDDAFARGIRFPELSPADERALRARMRELDVLGSLRWAATLARLSGDGYMVLDDGDFLAAPLAPDYQIGSLTSLPVFDGTAVIPNNLTIRRAFNQPDFDKPRQFLLSQAVQQESQPRQRFNPTREFIGIHPSRMIRFTYKQAPPGGWVESEQLVGELNRSYASIGVLNTILPLVMGELESIGAVRKLTTQASFLDLQIQDFDQLVSSNDEQVRQRVARIAATASVFGIFAHPVGTSLNRVAVNFGGLNDVLVRNLDRVAVAVDIPLSRFTGVEPTGLNASQEGSSRRHASKISAFQREEIDPALSRIIPLLAQDIGIDPDVRWEWPDYVIKSTRDRLDERQMRIANLNSSFDVLQRAQDVGAIDEMVEE